VLACYPSPAFAALADATEPAGSSGCPTVSNDFGAAVEGVHIKQLLPRSAGSGGTTSGHDRHGHEHKVELDPGRAKRGHPPTYGPRPAQKCQVGKQRGSRTEGSGSSRLPEIPARRCPVQLGSRSMAGLGGQQVPGGGGEAQNCHQGVEGLQHHQALRASGLSNRCSVQAAMALTSAGSHRQGGSAPLAAAIPASPPEGESPGSPELTQHRGDVDHRWGRGQGMHVSRRRRFRMLRST